VKAEKAANIKAALEKISSPAALEAWDRIIKNGMKHAEKERSTTLKSFQDLKQGMSARLLPTIQVPVSSSTTRGQDDSSGMNLDSEECFTPARTINLSEASESHVQTNRAAINTDSGVLHTHNSDEMLLEPVVLEEVSNPHVQDESAAIEISQQRHQTPKSKASASEPMVISPSNDESAVVTPKAARKLPPLVATQMTLAQSSEASSAFAVSFCT
jgi:hypothetical protein